MVYLAQDSVLRRPIALKRLHPHLLHHAETRARFEVEALAVAGFAHENIVRLYDLVREDDRIMLAFEYIEGGNLTVLLEKAKGPLSNLASLSIAIQLLSGLAAAHAKGMVHRDVKPGNILLGPEGQVKLTDFGVAHLAGENTLTHTGHLLGTPQFMAPEQADGRAIGPAVDVFAAGVLFYRCFSGHYPFQGMTPQEVLANISRCQCPPLGAMNSQLLPGVSEWVAGMLAKRPEARPSATLALSQGLEIAQKLDLPVGPKVVAAAQAQPELQRQEEAEFLCVYLRQRADRERAAGKAVLALKLDAAAQAFANHPSSLKHEKPTQALKSLQIKSSPKPMALLFGGGIALFLILGALAIGLYRQRAATPMASGPNSAPKDQVTSANVALPLPSPSAVLTEPVAPVRPKTEITPALPRREMAKAPAPSTKKIERVKSPTASRSDTLASPALFKVNEPLSPLPETPSSGHFKIWTQPPFAEVWLDGSHRGQSPLKEGLDLPIGAHQIRLRRPGYSVIDSSFTLNHGDTVIWRLRLHPQ